MYCWHRNFYSCSKYLRTLLNWSLPSSVKMAKFTLVTEWMFCFIAFVMVMVLFQSSLLCAEMPLASESSPPALTVKWGGKRIPHAIGYLVSWCLATPWRVVSSSDLSWLGSYVHVCCSEQPDNQQLEKKA